MKLIKKTVFVVVMLAMIGCTSKTNTNSSTELADKKVMQESSNLKSKASVMLIVKATTELSDEEFLRIAKEREPQFNAIPGLVQKYYIKIRPGEYGGVYIWDSKESLKKFKESELAATIGKAYKTIDEPSVEVANIMFQLRE